MLAVCCRFCNGVKDLELMTVNVIISAFTTVLSVEKGIEILDVFMHLQSREVGSSGGEVVYVWDLEAKIEPPCILCAG